MFIIVDPPRDRLLLLFGQDRGDEFKAKHRIDCGNVKLGFREASLDDLAPGIKPTLLTIHSYFIKLPFVSSDGFKLDSLRWSITQSENKLLYILDFYYFHEPATTSKDYGYGVKVYVNQRHNEVNPRLVGLEIDTDFVNVEHTDELTIDIGEDSLKG